MYQLPSHNLNIIPAVTHYDSNGNITKKIEYHPQHADFGGDIDLTIYNKDGTISDEFKIPFRSFNNNFMLMLYGYGINSAQTAVDTGGTNRSLSVTTHPFSMAASANNNAYGIQVGASGSSATQSIDTRALSGLITTGTARGQLQYSAVAVDSALSQISGSWTFSALRTFTNASTGNVNVTEVGAVMLHSSFNIMIARDITDANGTAINVTVAPTQVLTVKYNFYFPISNGMTQFLPAYLLMGFLGATISNVYYIYGDGDGNITTGITTGNTNRLQWNSAAIGTGPVSTICVGTGSQPLSCENWKIDWITQGSGSDQQLMHQGAVVDGYTKTYSTSGSAVEFVVRRTFVCAGPNVTVREAALFGSLSSNVMNAGTIAGSLAGVFIRTLTGDQVIVSGSSMEIAYKLMIAA